MNSSQEKKRQLYLDCEAAALRLLKEYKEQTSLFGRALALMNMSEGVTLASLDEIKIFRSQVRQRMEALASGLDAWYSLPILIDAITKFYEGKGIHHITHLGISMKVSMDFIWKNIFDDPAKERSASFSLLTDVLRLGSLFTALQPVQRIWEVRDLGSVVIHRKGFTTSELYFDIGKQLAEQGRHEYKSLDDAVKYIWGDIDNFFAKINTLVSIAPPDPRALFPGSFLAEIPASNIRFWGNIWARIWLFVGIWRERGDVVPADQVMSGVAFLSNNVLMGYGVSLKPELQAILTQTFWQQPWYRAAMSQPEEYDLQGMIVERPVLRLTAQHEVYGTSALLMMDSVNAILEEYVHSPAGNQVYEKYFSGPFEMEMIELFRSHGWRAGEVSASGAWKDQHGLQVLQTKTPSPGQIDVLAISPRQRTVLVAECKLLKFPNGPKVFKNLINKIGDDDGDGFHARLTRKNKWLQTVKNLDAGGYAFHQVLVTHRFVPFALDSKHLIVSRSQLEDCLQSNLPVTEWKDRLRRALNLD